MRRVRIGLASAALALGLLWGPPARADVIDAIAKRIVAFEAEAAQLEQGLRPPNVARQSGDEQQRRLVEAQVAHGVGNYADASIILYDLVEKHRQSRVWPEAVFYLADSLFQKGDYLTSKQYFDVIVRDIGPSDKNYQKSLERLIEIALRVDDTRDVPDYLDRLSRVPRGARLPSVPYVRGKYLYFEEKYDEARAAFATIPRSSPYYFQARYFVGATHIAQGQLAPAAKVFSDLLKEPVKTKDQQRITELAYLALGRLHYERDQLSQAIDSYLKVPRRSDLFETALYEVAWVYVKSKQYDKALRALELLSLANPDSASTPEVKILEGNLRIRKAQALSKAAKGNETEEYAKAQSVFETTRDTFQESRDRLEEALKDHEDPRKFFKTITGKAIEAFDVQVDLPEKAVAWVREEPDVKRVVGVTETLAEIRRELDESDQILQRLEAAVESASRVQIFPELASKRARAREIEEGVFAARQQLATHERALVEKYVRPEEQAELRRLRDERQRLAQELAKMPDHDASYTERIQAARARFLNVDKRAQEVEVVINTLEAELVAVEKYYQDTRDEDWQKVPPEDYARIAGEIRAEIDGLRQELSALRGEITTGMDQAGVGDELARREKKLRDDLDAAVKRELAYMRQIHGRMDGDDRQKAAQAQSLIARTYAIDQVIARMNRKIDQILDAELASVRTALQDERTRLEEYRQTLAAYEAENASLGSEIIYSSFATVSKKFYDIVVRADLGVVDIAWARNQEAKDMVNRLNLDAARERRVLTEEFRDVLEEPVGETE